MSIQRNSTSCTDCCRLFYEKKTELGDAASKLRNGLSKIDETREKVEGMSVELEDAKKKVAQFQKQCEEYLVVIVQQKREADEQQKVSTDKHYTIRTVQYIQVHMSYFVTKSTTEICVHVRRLRS